ncbi:MAG: hypothetical protein P1V51_24530 [Deltaproteobacteria bacterium]|nr:hypothetical protein [Deltaproteobacteria bacterium]
MIYIVDNGAFYEDRQVFYFEHKWGLIGPQLRALAQLAAESHDAEVIGRAQNILWDNGSATPLLVSCAGEASAYTAMRVWEGDEALISYFPALILRKMGALDADEEEWAAANAARAELRKRGFKVRQARRAAR